MKIIQAGPLQVHVVGGTEGDGGGPAVLLCHGYGAGGDDLVSLARVVEAGPEVRWFFPEAPLEVNIGMGMRGRAWWALDIARLQALSHQGDRRTLARELPEGLEQAKQALESCIASLVAHHHVDPQRLLIGGFSQGAMLATELSLFSDISYAGLVLLSGTLLCEERWERAAHTRAGGLEVLQSHGRYDPLLPFHLAEALRELLTRSGATVDWVPFAGQHEIPYDVLKRLGEFAKKRLTALPISGATQ